MNHPKRRAPLPIIDNLLMLKDRLFREATIYQLVKTSSYASMDYQTVTQFLLSYDGSLDTFNAYRRELERLLQWSWLVQ